ncbi:hypothetical protein Dole_0418 [Desulfosudis oleivorans Hxd3]|uniref:Uncharacterized protein n=1 Tax=Desulfosudis oleivorans (strain DSM 6200 / JCM 39069 / Hxd3) TaxID=96561 RepID=A8ZTG4_DESOH|nr:hypothetical protein Dole_0418 [Desulfosudis oleivorans Hxd3]
MRGCKTRFDQSGHQTPHSGLSWSTRQKKKQGIVDDVQFGRKYLNVWWDRACKNLGVEDVNLYGGTGQTTNKVFDRYFQPQKQEHVKVVTAIQKLKEDARSRS